MPLLTDDNLPRLYVVFFALSVLAYLVCLPLHPYCAAAHCESTGFYVLIMGWASIMTFHIAGLCWIANPLLFVGWFFLYKRNRKLSLRLCGVAFVFAFIFMINNHIPGADIGGSDPITGYGPGYVIWLLSILFALVSATYLPPAELVPEFEEVSEEVVPQPIITEPLPEDDLPVGDSDPA